MGVEMGMEMVSPHIPEDTWLDPLVIPVCVEQVEGETSITGMLPGPPFLPTESCFSKAGMLTPCLKAQAREQKVMFGPACKY